MTTRRKWQWLVLAPWLLIATACHEEGDIRVAGLTFEGNEHVPTNEIKAILATRTGGRLPWSPSVPFDKQEFQNDLIRIQQLYEARGYPNVRVSALDVDLNEKGDAVRLRIGIDEGTPVVIHDVRYVGFEVLSPRLQEQVRGGAPAAGEPRDRSRLTTFERLARETFVDNGYAHATVTVTEESGATPGGIVITADARPGPPTVFGDIAVVGNVNVTEAMVRRQLTFAPGDPYRQRDVIRSERRLGTLEILRFADIDASAPPETRPTRIPVTVTLAEDPPRRLELRGGYGTEDRLRGSVEWSHLNFLGNARRLTATTKWSSIDRGVRLGLTQPYFFRAGLAFDASASSWWTSEQIYTSDVMGGRVGLSYRIGNRGRGEGRSPIDVIRVAYLVERVGYTVRPEVLEDLTNVDTLIGLGLDPITGEGNGTKAAIALDYERTATDNIANPRQGYSVALQYEEARPSLGGTFDFRKMSAEGRAYVPLGRAVVAGRVRGGTIVARSDADAPFSERYFLGGSTSLRGWGRYQVSPLQDGIAVGGRTLLDSALELRVPVRDPFGVVFFIDAGNVWSESLAARTSGLRSDAGIGLRYATPIGTIRGDIGFQLNPVEGLRVDGEIEPRHWRIHLSIGQAF